MVTSNPMRGLITLSYFKIKSKVLGGIIYALILGVAFLGSEIEIIKGMFVMASMISLPLQVLVGISGENEGKWERFQVSLPIKRSYLLNAQYLLLIFMAVLGGIILTVGIGISTVVHEGWFNYGFVSAMRSSVHLYGLAFMAIGLCFLLSFVVGDFAAWIIAMFIPTVFAFILPNVAYRLDISVYTLSVSVFAASVVFFIASYFAMKAVYEKFDF